MVFMVCKNARRRSPASPRPAQGEVERRPLVLPAFAPDASAVTVDDALHQRQPHAGPLEVGCRVQALKHTEQLACVPHVEAGAVVPHIVHTLAVIIPRTDLDLGVGALARELEGIADEIREDLTQQRAVAHGGRAAWALYLPDPGPGWMLPRRRDGFPAARQ